MFKTLSIIMSFVSTKVVVHRPISSECNYIPHPMYDINTPKLKQRDIDFLYFGSVSKYKGLVELLLSWPPYQKFTILGKSNDLLLSEQINNIIIDRGLSVTWINDFLSTDLLNDYLSRTKYVVLPHLDKSMIVSGAFYHAASSGCNVVMLKSEFSQYCTKNFSFITEFDYESLATNIDDIKYTNSEEVFVNLSDTCSISHLSSLWKNILY